MNKYLLIIIVFVCSLIGNAYGNNEPAPPKGKIKGAVVDAKNKNPLEYATVALYDINNKLITGSITDYLGHFKIDRPEDGDYYLVITFIGLKEKKSDVFKVKGDNNINLGNIYLESDSKYLNEVVVKAKRASVQYKIDRKVINVDKQLTAEAGTAVDILENVPSVQVDIEGNVTLRGSSGFTVLIDGKPTILEPSDALRQIPSSSIENIEIITNPSVKYEPDGATGIINIITKKSYLDGLSGIVNLNAGMYGQYGGDLQLNYRVNKVSFLVGTYFNHRSRPGDVLNERQTISDDTTFFVNSFGETKREFQRSGIRAGVEYNPTKNDFMSLSGRYGSWDMTNNSTLHYDDWTSPGTTLYSYNSFDETTRGGGYLAIDGVYQHDFKSIDEEEKLKGGGKMKGGKAKMKQSVPHNVKLEFNYRNRNNDEFAINELRSLSDSLLGGKKNVEKGPAQMFKLKLDYSTPVKEKDKFEAGLQGRYGHSNDVTELWLYNIETGEVENVPEFNNITDYYRNIYAAYALYAGYFGEFGYQAGLRTEYTDRKVETTGEDEFLLNRWDLFPTIHVSHNLPHDQQVMASYSRRIDRPRGWELEPFIIWQDTYNVRQGNPNLKPEYIDSYDLGYLVKFNDNFLSLEGYYRVTHNKVERVSSVYQENVMLNTVENVGKDYSLGLEAMLSIGVTNWWDMDLSGNLYNYKIEGTLYEETFNRTSTNWSTRFNNTFTVWEHGQLQLSSRYNSTSVTAQGTSKGYYTVDGAFKMSFMDRRLTANLQVRDIFGTALREHDSEGQNFSTHYSFTPSSPVASISISYRFNNFKMNKRSSNDNGGDDEL
jgi:outer membrane receptor protein involved in Fe transport